MTTATPQPLLFDNSLYLELPIEQLEAPPQHYASASANERAWLNGMALSAIQTWLKEDMALKSKVWPNRQALPSQWELVNGTALTVNGNRWVLIPETTIDQRELRVPQEWVEIADWAADYYLAVRLNLDEGWLRLWGYTSHAQLKAQGTLDLSDRSYSLDEDHLLSNIDALCLAQKITFGQPLRGPIAATASLAIDQAHQLLERLGQPSVTFPRLSIPFSQWASLISHGGWRQRLYERRQGLPEQRSVLQWFQDGISSLGQQTGWQTDTLALQPAMSMRGEATEEPVLSREILIAEESLILVVTRCPGEIAQAWRFMLCPIAAEAKIPAGTVLRLLSESLEPFEHNEDVAGENCSGLYVDVVVDPGEGIVWETEPTAEDYLQEILRF